MTYSPSPHTPLKCNEEKLTESHTLAARALCVDPMKGRSVSRREGSHSGLDWTHSQAWLSWWRLILRQDRTHWATLSPFQAWKAHLMGREGCKQNSRRTAVTQRTQPAQGKAFTHPLLTPTSAVFAGRAAESASAERCGFYAVVSCRHEKNGQKVVTALIRRPV